MKLKQIIYDHIDLINLIKNNTSLFTDANPADLYIEFKITKNSKINIAVFRKNKKDLEIIC